MSFCRKSFETNLPSVRLECIDVKCVAEQMYPNGKINEEKHWESYDGESSLEIVIKDEEYYPALFKNVSEIKIKDEKLYLGSIGDETEIEILDEKYYPGSGNNPFGIKIKEEKYSPCSSDNESEVVIKDEEYYPAFLDTDDSSDMDVKKEQHTPASFSEDAGVPDLGKLISVDITCKTTSLLKSDSTSEVGSKRAGKTFTCAICSAVYTTKATLGRHRRLKHPSAIGTRCKKISRTYNGGEIYSNDIRKYICPFCKKDYLYKTTLHSHIKIQHPEKVPLKCNKCSKKLISRQALVSHVNKCVSTKFQCSLCSILFECKTHLSEHIYTKHKAGYQCNVCLKKLRSQRGLSIHGKKCFAPRPQLTRHVCSVCSNGYSARYTLLQHTRLKHPNTMTFACNNCSDRFLTDLDLEEHLRKCRATKRQYGCAACPKEFAYKKSLERHTLREHTKILI